MRVGAVVLRGRAKADMRLGDNQNRLSLYVHGPAIDAVDRVVIVPVALQNLPAIALKTLFDVVRKRKRRCTFNCNRVGVVDKDEVVQLHRASPAAGFVRNALFHVAVATEHPRAVGRRRLLRRKREPDAHRDALPERTRRHVDARQKSAFGMPCATASELAEVLELVHRKPAHPRKVEERIDERARMPARKHKAVASRPLGIRRRDVQKLEPQRNGQVRHAERSARVSRFRLVDHVRAQAADRIRGKFELFVRNLHNFSFLGSPLNQLLNRNSTTSPSCISYSLPSGRKTPASRAPFSPPYLT